LRDLLNAPTLNCKLMLKLEVCIAVGSPRPEANVIVEGRDVKIISVVGSPSLSGRRPRWALNDIVGINGSVEHHGQLVESLAEDNWLLIGETTLSGTNHLLLSPIISGVTSSDSLTGAIGCELEADINAHAIKSSGVLVNVADIPTPDLSPNGLDPVFREQVLEIVRIGNLVECKDHCGCQSTLASRKPSTTRGCCVIGGYTI